MVDLGQEEAFWGTLWKAAFNDKFAAEDTAFIGCLDYTDGKKESGIVKFEDFKMLTWTNDVCLDVGNVAIFILIEDHA